MDVSVLISGFQTGEYSARSSQVVSYRNPQPHTIIISVKNTSSILASGFLVQPMAFRCGVTRLILPDEDSLAFCE